MEDYQKKLMEMEEESNRLKMMQKQVDDQMTMVGGQSASSDEIDARSIYVGNVDYSTTPEELQNLFQACGTINRVTILCDKYTGQPKGYAYVEFVEPEAVSHAIALNESPLKGRFIKVSAKRTNIPGLSVRGRGRGRGGFFPHPYSYPPRGGFRGRGSSRRGHFNPYSAPTYY